MSTRKRKSLDESPTVGVSPAEEAFLKGEQSDRPTEKKQVQPEEERPAMPKETQLKLKSQRSSIVSQLLQDAPEKEATVRITVDLPESMHRKLSILCARTRKSKAEVVRLLLDEVLDEVNE